MNIVNACSKLECDMVHAILLKRYNSVYADCWKIGLNLSLRIGDLLSLKYSDIDFKNRSIKITESKTGKQKEIRINSAANIVIERRLSDNPTDLYLFQVHSNRAQNQPISRVSVSRVFKSVGDGLGIAVSTHSMRKSRGKALYDAGVPLEMISKTLNHSNTSSTLRYLGITQSQILQTYDDFEL